MLVLKCNNIKVRYFNPKPVCRKFGNVLSAELFNESFSQCSLIFTKDVVVNGISRALIEEMQLCINRKSVSSEWNILRKIFVCISDFLRKLMKRKTVNEVKFCEKYFRENFAFRENHIGVEVVTINWAEKHVEFSALRTQH